MQAKFYIEQKFVFFKKGIKFYKDDLQFFKSLQNIIEEAIKKGGSSIKDFTTPQDELGYFQTQFQVYGREGLPCYYCKSLITGLHKVVDQLFCRKCQS